MMKMRILFTMLLSVTMSLVARSNPQIGYDTGTRGSPESILIQPLDYLPTDLQIVETIVGPVPLRTGITILIINKASDLPVTEQLSVNRKCRDVDLCPKTLRSINKIEANNKLILPSRNRIAYLRYHDGGGGHGNT